MLERIVSWRKVVGWCLLIGIGSVLLAACGSSQGKSSGGASNGPKKKIIAFLYAPRGFNDVSKAWWNGWEQGAKNLGSSFEVELKATEKVEPEAGEYLSFIEQALVEKPAGIVVVPNVASAMQSGLERIASAGTKVLLMDENISGMRNKVSFVGTNNKVAGETAAKWMSQQKLPSDEVAVFGSPPGISSADERLAGIEEGLAGSKLKVVTLKRIPCESTPARTELAGVLTTHPNLGGVFTICDNMALGAIQALKASGKHGIELASIDATAAGVESIIKGTGIDAEVAQHLFKVGQESIETLGRALEGKRVPADVDTGSELVTAANAKEYLKQAAAESK